MRYIIVDNKKQIGQEAAKIFEKQINKKPDSVLGLATGSTPIPLYEELIRLNRKKAIDFSKVRTVNLDEYIGLEDSHEQSYRYFMDKNLFSHINIKRENTALPNGMAEDTEAECQRYDKLIVAFGGIDLQLLGIGHNGHIGFNEPGTEFIVKTHVVRIAEKTRLANSRFFGNNPDEVPKEAVTMGIGNIMSAKKIVLLVSGKDKAEILKEAFMGSVTPAVPASVLQLHENVVVIADREAAEQFDMRIKQVL